MIGHAYDGMPNEACGLLAGTPGVPAGDVGGVANALSFYPCRNAANSSRVYTVDHRDYARSEDDADAKGMTLVGVMHSHTHTEAYPSPTDVEAAFDPAWHYVIVSLRDDAPVLRSYRIIDGSITEERVALVEESEAHR